jgi:hypothetical protein
MLAARGTRYTVNLYAASQKLQGCESSRSFDVHFTRPASTGLLLLLLVLLLPVHNKEYNT